MKQYGKEQKQVAFATKKEMEEVMQEEPESSDDFEDCPEGKVMDLFEAADKKDPNYFVPKVDAKTLAQVERMEKKEAAFAEKLKQLKLNSGVEMTDYYASGLSSTGINYTAALREDPTLPTDIVLKPPPEYEYPHLIVDEDKEYHDLNEEEKAVRDCLNDEEADTKYEELEDDFIFKANGGAPVLIQDTAGKMVIPKARPAGHSKAEEEELDNVMKEYEEGDPAKRRYHKGHDHDHEEEDDDYNEEDEDEEEEEEEEEEKDNKGAEEEDEEEHHSGENKQKQKQKQKGKLNQAQFDAVLDEFINEQKLKANQLDAAERQKELEDNVEAEEPSKGENKKKNKHLFENEEPEGETTENRQTLKRKPHFPKVSVETILALEEKAAAKEDAAPNPHEDELLRPTPKPIEWDIETIASTCNNTDNRPHVLAEETSTKPKRAKAAAQHQQKPQSTPLCASGTTVSPMLATLPPQPKTETETARAPATVVKEATGTCPAAAREMKHPVADTVKTQKEKTANSSENSAEDKAEEKVQSPQEEGAASAGTKPEKDSTQIDEMTKKMLAKAEKAQRKKAVKAQQREKRQLKKDTKLAFHVE